MFFKIPSIGIDISDHSMEIIVLKGSDSNPQLSVMGRDILDPGVIENGKILQRGILKSFLKQLLKNPDFGKVRTNRVIFSLPESKSFLHIFELPRDVKKKDEINCIRFQAKQTFPYSLEDVYFDFKAVKRGEVKEIILIASPKEVIDDYIALFKECQLNPLILEIQSVSLGRSLIQNVKETIMLVDIGAKTTDFSIFDKGELRFSHTIDIAGDRLTKSIAENLSVSFFEAEKLKKENGLNPEVKEGKIFLILQKEIRAIIKEIGKIEEYYMNKGNEKIKEIILAGGSAGLINFPEYLVENLQKPVFVGDPWKNINIDVLKKKEYFKKAFEVNPVFYSTPIGCALRGLAKNPEEAGINLLRK